MSWSPHVRNFQLPEVDQAKVDLDQIAYFSVIELPFRLRLGRFCRMPVADGMEIACLNRINLPKPSGYPVETLPLVKDRHLVNTRLCVLENSGAVKQQDLDSIRNAEGFPSTTLAAELLKQKPGPQLLHLPDHRRPLEAIRRFIDLYFKYCPPQFQSDKVRPLWMDDYYSLGVVYGLCLHPKGKGVPSPFLRVLLQSENPRSEERDIGAALWHDAPSKQRKAFAKSLRSGEQSDLTTQLMLLSFSYRQQFNMEMAVITAVAALEAALFEFSKVRLGPHLADDRELTGAFLREQGASILVQVVPRLFFREDNVPSKEVFAGVKKAISARNKIMHGKVDDEGRPRHLNMGHLGEAISDCGELVAAFQREVSLHRRRFSR